MSWVTDLARPEIVVLRAYEPAAWEPQLTRLHANELPWRVPGDESQSGLNRYPESQPRELISRLAQLYGVGERQVLATRGSDEAIDLLIRAFCRAGADGVLVCAPSFGMYEIAARIQGARIVVAHLRPGDAFALDPSALLERWTPEVRLVFLCSPNNPTGNRFEPTAILHIARALAGRCLIVVDEAYVEFASGPSLAPRIAEVPNLAVLRTLSKAHGLAGARLGAVIADAEVIALLRKVVPPYAIAQLTLEAALRVLGADDGTVSRRRVRELVAERERLSVALRELPDITQVWPSDANFILAEFADPARALQRARAARLLVRDVRAGAGLSRALRISVGSPEQNSRLLEAWR